MVVHLPKNRVPLLVEESRPGRRGEKVVAVPKGFKAADLVPKALRRLTPPALPELTQPEVIRHYTRLSQLNYGLDAGMIPLGSCTMKHNPRLADLVSGLEDAARIHPLQHPSQIQGALRIMYESEQWLKEVLGMDAVSLHPAAGAHGEFLGLALIRAYHESRGEGAKRTKVVLPDTAHGTNPATAAMIGYEVVEIASNADGTVDLAGLQAALGPDTACFMLTNPNTLGIFENQIQEIQKAVHAVGGLLYYDGANLNAIMGKASPGSMGFDVCHTNVHKTFAIPHGAGGPGGGPVGVKERLVPFLPNPRIVKRGDRYEFADSSKSIGKIREYWGGFLVQLRCLAYLLLMGGDGLVESSEIAVLNAAYMQKRLVGAYELPYKQLRKHEFVLSAANLKRERGINAKDIAKRLLDHGFYAPTIYFPLIVDEALMIEPTESEPKDELDAFVDALLAIAKEDPAVVKAAPKHAPVARVDDVWAAKNLVLTWRHLAKLEERPRPAARSMVAPAA
ncbi:MAG: aminomethyl-transferring glycine dehydrogenase subunit GcvPB [Euryarchaeota archaeon]|nr:aminomethyl-transferring glycine dehydrogenase subunit GcvPB [Euryarchaeota archaeon]